MRVIQISEMKKEKLSTYAEGIMSMAEKLMECVEHLEGEDSYGERSRYGLRMDDDSMSDDRMGERWSAYGNRRNRR